MTSAVTLGRSARGGDAYDVLKADLLRGALASGTRMSERALCARLGVSRTPLREALLRLEQQQLIERSDTGAWRVRGLDERDVRDIFACRSQLEELAVRLAIERGADAEIRRLGHHLDEAEAAHRAGDVAAMTAANAAFHTDIYRVAHSSWLETVIEPLRSQTIRIRFIIADHVLQPSYPEEHRVIYDALVARDAQRAEQIIRSHVDADLRVAIRHFEVLRTTASPERPGARST